MPDWSKLPEPSAGRSSRFSSHSGLQEFHNHPSRPAELAAHPDQNQTNPALVKDITSENHPVAIWVRFLHGVFRHVGHKAKQPIKRAIVLHAVPTEPGR